MNDQIKLLVAGATIALAGVVAGGTIVGWTLQMESAGKAITVSSPKPLQFTSAPNNPAFRSILPSTNVPQVRLPSQFTIPSGSINAPGVRPQPLNSAAFQKVQGEPEVKAAREALAEAQKKYMAAMQKAMGEKTGVRGQPSAVSFQPSAAGDRGVGANTSKITPLTIQIPPSVSATNAAAKTRL